MSDENSSIALTTDEQAFFDNGGDVADDSSAATENSNTGAETPAQEEKPEASVDAPVAEATPEPEVKPVPEKTVPLAALHQARAENREIKERMARMEAIFQQMQQQARQEQAPQIPSLENDVVGHFDARQAILEQNLQQIHQQQLTWQQQQQEQAQRQKFQEVIGNLESQFAQKVPDYNNATKHLKDSIYMGFIEQGATEDQAFDAVNRQMWAIAQQASSTGINPAELAYNMALARGYSRPQQKAAPPVQTNAQKIQQIEKGKQAGSIANAGGTGNKPELTLASLAEMSDEEMAANWHKVVRR